MKVYHGSTEVIKCPLVSKGRQNLDFGQGFYITDIIKQAKDWATRPINKAKPQYLNIYEFDSEMVKAEGYHYVKFEEYDGYWLDFVITNRHGEKPTVEYDIVEGGIANDRVFNTIELYDAGLITREEALSRLRYETPNNQICILRQDIIDKYLLFEEAQLLNGNGR